MTNARGERPRADVKCRTHVARERARGFNAVARRTRVACGHQRHLAIDHGVTVTPLVAVHEILVGAHSVRQSVLLRASKGPASAVLNPTGAVLTVVGFDVEASSRNGGRTLQPSQGFGHRRVGQDVAEGQFGLCGVHHAVQLVPVAGKPRLVHLRGHGPPRRGIEFVSDDDVGMVG